MSLFEQHFEFLAPTQGLVWINIWAFIEKSSKNARKYNNVLVVRLFALTDSLKLDLILFIPWGPRSQMVPPAVPTIKLIRGRKAHTSAKKGPSLSTAGRSGLSTDTDTEPDRLLSALVALKGCKISEWATTQALKNVYDHRWRIFK